MEVATEQLMRDKPLPDSGSLEGDLRKWARSIATGLRSREGSLFFQAFVATAMPSGIEDETRIAAMLGRLDQIAMILERARARGEQPLEVTDGPLAGPALHAGAVRQAGERSRR